MITIIKPGLMTSFQDLGRYGHQKYGVITSGVMDPIAHRLANLLVGNQENEATMEITLYGPTIQFEKNMLIALCGGDLSPTVNDVPVKMWSPVLVKQGDVLTFGEVKTGCRTYLAVHGGYVLEEVMGSKSTYLRAKFGGLDGRLLKEGDQILIKNTEYSNYDKSFGFNVSAHFASYTSKVKKIRVMRGRQYASFKKQSINDFFHCSFTVSHHSDRMGYRLTGPILELEMKKEMISEGVSYGSIQVPADGNPIILLADRQTIGGYPKIAQVATVDFSIIAQTRPGEEVYFEEIRHEEAQRLWLVQEAQIQYIKQGIRLKYEQGVT